MSSIWRRVRTSLAPTRSLRECHFDHHTLGFGDCVVPVLCASHSCFAFFFALLSIPPARTGSSTVASVVLDCLVLCLCQACLLVLNV